MALKNTYIKLPAQTYIKEVQDALVKAGANGVSFMYENQRVSGLSFSLDLRGQIVNFALPVNWRKFQQVLAREGIGRSYDDEYCYRVAWACMRDWIEAQMAFVESENVTVPQLFLPYVVMKGGQTLFDQIMENKFLLGDGN